jgi:hypothetical protein
MKKLIVTPAQLDAIMEAADTISAQIGGADNDKEAASIVKRIDNMLKKNGFKRKFT